jgi:mono/diheme cytochrome c family protein
MTSSSKFFAAAVASAFGVLVAAAPALAADGKALFATKGCVACHEPRLPLPATDRHQKRQARQRSDRRGDEADRFADRR